MAAEAAAPYLMWTSRGHHAERTAAAPYRDPHGPADLHTYPQGQLCCNAMGPAHLHPANGVSSRVLHSSEQNSHHVGLDSKNSFKDTKSSNMN
ncbi:hypothetical protein STEG23_028402 [Scotinomys teguina]